MKNTIIITVLLLIFSFKSYSKNMILNSKEDELVEKLYKDADFKKYIKFNTAVVFAESLIHSHPEKVTEEYTKEVSDIKNLSAEKFNKLTEKYFSNQISFESKKSIFIAATRKLFDDAITTNEIINCVLDGMFYGAACTESDFVIKASYRSCMLLCGVGDFFYVIAFPEIAPGTLFSIVSAQSNVCDILTGIVDRIGCTTIGVSKIVLCINNENND